MNESDSCATFEPPRQTALERFKAMKRDNGKLVSELKAQRAIVANEQRLAKARVEKLECDLIDIEDAISQLEKP